MLVKLAAVSFASIALPCRTLSLETKIILRFASTRIIEAVFSLPKDFDVLIVDDGSPDGTANIVKELQELYQAKGVARLHLLQRQGKQGLGTAYISGFKYALNPRFVKYTIKNTD